MAKHERFDVLTSATWLYPFKGLVYFAFHPAFHPLLRSRIVPITLLSIFIYAILFVFTYLPQVAFLALFNRPAGAAWLNGTFLVLGEGLVIVSLLFEGFFVDEQCVDSFDGVLVAEGLQDLVAQNRVLRVNDDEVRGNPVKMLGAPTEKAIYSPFSLRQIIEFIFFLPLNFIPYIGVPLFLIITGYRAGPLHHWRYFQLLGFTKKERQEFIKKRQIKYTLFGTVALLLQLVPGMSMVFLLTSAAGSALWVVRMEKARRARDAFDEGRRRDAEVDGEVGEYRDDPV